MDNSNNNKQHNIMIIMIVAIVAIVAIVVLVLNNQPHIETTGMPISGETSSVGSSSSRTCNCDDGSKAENCELGRYTCATCCFDKKKEDTPTPPSNPGCNSCTTGADCHTSGNCRNGCCA